MAKRTKKKKEVKEESESDVLVDGLKEAMAEADDLITSTDALLAEAANLPCLKLVANL